MKLDETVKKIKNLEIQGASSVARSSLKALEYVANHSKADSRKKFLKELDEAKKKLFNTRPTEPMMRNALKYVLWKARKTSKEDYKNETKEIIKSLYGRTGEAKEKVFEIGSNVVEKDDIVLTHCHSSNVMGILKKAKPKKVFCTESRPRYQGRISAKELVNAGINTSLIVDNAAIDFIKKVDMVLIGCDVITPNSVINKIGSRVISILCEKYDTPMYVCSTSYKFDPKSTIGKGVSVEERSPDEVWKNPPEGLEILNPAFDSVDYDNIKSFINELGVFSPDSLFITLRNKYKWMIEI